jgi:ABC-type multidrug transport system fused ATPase/permease subunit
MSEQKPKQKRKNTHFWRACRFLWPYRKMFTVSVVSAFLVGLSMAGSFGAMLPIIRVLINGDTVQGWIYRQTAAQRLGATLSQEPGRVQIIDVTPGGPADRAGLKIAEGIESAEPPQNAPISPFANPQAPGMHSENYRKAVEVERSIAWADRPQTSLVVQGLPTPVQLNPPRWYTPFALRMVERLPVQPVQSIAAVFGFMAAMSIVGQVFRFVQEYFSGKAAIYAVNDIRRRLYARVLRIPLAFFGQQGTSDVTSRLVQDAGILQEGFKQVLGQAIQEPIKASIAMCYALWLSWKLTLFMILFSPVMAILIGKFGKKMRRASRAALQSSAVMLGQIEGTLSGIRVVKASSAERFEGGRYMGIMDRLTHEQVKMAYIDAIGAPILESLIMLMAGAVVLVAAHMVLVARSLEPQDFVVVMVLMATIAESLRRSSKVFNVMQKSNAAAARIFQTLDLPVESRLRQRAVAGRNGSPTTPPLPLKHLRPLQSQIEFNGVTFSYPNSQVPALSDLDLVVPRGQSIAIVGRNGSGKTTLLALLPRFYEPQAGQIVIDGLDIRAATLRSLRNQISIVTQDSVIFPGTIAQNIAYGNRMAGPNASDSPLRQSLMMDIEEAAKQAFAHEFIMEKPQGYQTILGEMGGQLSGGQRQRLCIARAILRKSPILILDEATSQVDAESEHLIQQAIEHLMHERTTFVIAHRFSTIASADRIVVMERGRIVGQGLHDELLKTCPTYQQLYERQLGSAGGSD